MRKTYLLHRNHSVTKTKESLKLLQSTGKLDSVDLVMIPIYDMKSIYMVVDGDFLATLRFSSAKIKYHMRLCATSTGKHDDMYDIVIYDYAPVSITAPTIEALYNCLHNIFALWYVRQSMCDADHAERTFYLEICELEVTIYDGKEVADHFTDSIRHVQDIPFDIDEADAFISRVKEHYGMTFTHGLIAHNITIRDGDKGRRWRKETERFELFSDISNVFIGNPFSATYILVDDNQYDQLLRMNNAYLYVMPIRYDKWGVSPDHPDVSLLTPTTHFDIPKYNFSYDYYDMSEFSESMSMMLEDATEEIFPFMMMDSEDIVVAIAYLKTIMMTYHEMVKVSMAEDLKRDDLSALGLVTTVAVDFSIDIDHPTSSPSEEDFHIYTDVYQDKLPTLKEVCYLLSIDEKSK